MGDWFARLQHELAEHGMSERHAKAHQEVEKHLEGRPHVEEPSEALRAAWRPVAAEIEAAVGGPTYRIWLEHLHPHGLVDGTWHLGVDPRAARWVEHRFGRLIERAAGRPVAYCQCRRSSFGGQPVS